MTLAPTAAPAPSPDTSVPPTQSVLSNRWLRFAVRRTGRLLVSLWVLITASFLMIHLVPGDPVRASLGQTAPADLVAARRAELGLDNPLWRQYLDFLGGLVSGDLGTSFTFRLPVSEVIGQRLPATLSLAVAAFVVAILIAVPLGTIAVPHWALRNACSSGDS